MAMQAHADAIMVESLTNLCAHLSCLDGPIALRNGQIMTL